MCSLCEFCGKSYKHLEYLKEHINVKHGNIKHQCDDCGHCFATKTGLTTHLECGHVQPSEDIIVFDGNKLIMEPFDKEKHTIKELRQVVVTPVYIENSDGSTTQKNVTVGLTTWNNVVSYAKKNWLTVGSALRKKQLRLVACGGMRMASNRQGYFMIPDEAFPMNVFVYERLSGSKVSCISHYIKIVY